MNPLKRKTKHFIVNSRERKCRLEFYVEIKLKIQKIASFYPMSNRTEVIIAIMQYFFKKQRMKKKTKDDLCFGKIFGMPRYANLQHDTSSFFPF